MALTLTPTRTAFIHDFDGVHLAYAAVPQIHQQFAIFAQDSALKISKERGIITDRATVKAILDRTFKERGNPSYAISEITGDESFDLQASFNRARHAKLFDWIKEHYPHACEIDQERIQYFEQLEIFGIQHGLLTAGEYDAWAKRFLEATNVLKFFKTSCLLDFRDVAGDSKAENSNPMQVAMHCLQVNPKQIVFIEDSLKNFEAIKRDYPDILTVLVNNEEDLTSHPDVDMQFQDLNAFLKFSSKTFSSYQCQNAMQHY